MFHVKSRQFVHTLIYNLLHLECHLLRWGWEFFQRKRILSMSGIQFITHFIELVVVETKSFVGSNVNVT